MTVSIARVFVSAMIIRTAPQKRVQFFLENCLDRGADIFAQTTFGRIIPASFASSESAAVALLFFMV